MKQTEKHEELWKALKPIKAVDVPEGLYAKVQQKIRNKQRELRFNIWQYAAAATLVLANALGIYYAQKSSTDTTTNNDQVIEQLASDYSWDSNEYYDY
ncbi:hypothetical protein BFP72_01090 [Reichenbachiella sp. 5M10]|uniref:hypothetical protein n=1 Tax=Reichenbachiella sp. 5M10 TaxID=1889772 RepID=UPI000C154075|nr:hypothetical protein [Reichenbachiella sp. 5M10]PIB34118.1 hypothetical protein BFP72_01090 [Reichenbachiella sp. 5M10]